VEPHQSGTNTPNGSPPYQVEPQRHRDHKMERRMPRRGITGLPSLDATTRLRLTQPMAVLGPTLRHEGWAPPAKPY
jgi:hypothetical protein